MSHRIQHSLRRVVWIPAGVLAVFMCSVCFAAGVDTFTNPSGGEVYEIGQTCYAHVLKAALKKNVLIELSRDGGTTWVTLGTIPGTLKTSPKEFIMAINLAGPPTSNAMLRASGAGSKGPITVLSHKFSITATNLAQGIMTGELADKSVTAAKINSESSVSGTVLTADGSGGASFLPVTSSLPSGSIDILKLSNTGATTGQAIFYNGVSLVYGNPVASDLILPFAKSQASAPTLFDLTNTGTGAAGNFAINNAADTSDALTGSTNGTGIGVHGVHSAATGIAAGVRGESNSQDANASAVVGVITPTAPGGFSAGVRGTNNGTGGLGIGVVGTQAGSGWGVYGTAPSGIGVYGLSTSGFGVYGQSTTGVSVYGIQASTGTSSAGYFQNTNPTNSSSTLISTTNGVGSAAYFENTNAANASNLIQAISNGTSTVLRVAATGTSNQVPLLVEGNDASYSFIYVNANNATATSGYGYERGSILRAYTGVNAANDFFLNVGTYTDVLRVNGTTGNVGISHFNPTEKLHVLSAANVPVKALVEAVGSSNSAGLRAKGSAGVNDYFEMTKFNATASGTIAGVNLASLSLLDTGADAGQMFIDVLTNNPMLFGTNNLVRMNLSASGNLGIGMGTTAGTRLLDVNGTARLGVNGTTVTNVIKATVSADVPSVGAGVVTTFTFAVANANVGSTVHISPANAYGGLIISYARVSAVGTVEMGLVNPTGAAIDPVLQNYFITVVE